MRASEETARGNRPAMLSRYTAHMDPEAPTTLSRVRALGLATLMLGIAGTATELLLIGHFDDVNQVVPLVLLALGLIIALWQAIAPGTASVRALQLTMAAFVISGAVGVLLHYQGNAEFELEMTPTLAGWELFRETITGATPVMAPGTMALLGLIGFAHAYRHPRRRG